jgi:hypothetical protein
MTEPKLNLQTKVYTLEEYAKLPKQKKLTSSEKMKQIRDAGYVIRNGYRAIGDKYNFHGSSPSTLWNLVFNFGEGR